MEEFWLAGALVLVFVGLAIWQCTDWIAARADVVKETARRMHLENEKLEKHVKTAGSE